MSLIMSSITCINRLIRIISYPNRCRAPFYVDVCICVCVYIDKIKVRDDDDDSDGDDDVYIAWIRCEGGPRTGMWFSHPGSDVATLYIFDKQLHYGRWRVSLRVASGVNLHPLPPTQPSISAEAAKHHWPALCGVQPSSCALWSHRGCEL